MQIYSMIFCIQTTLQKQTVSFLLVIYVINYFFFFLRKWAIKSKGILCNSSLEKVQVGGRNQSLLLIKKILHCSRSAVNVCCFVLWTGPQIFWEKKNSSVDCAFLSQIKCGKWSRLKAFCSIPYTSVSHVSKTLPLAGESLPNTFTVVITFLSILELTRMFPVALQS